MNFGIAQGDEMCDTLLVMNAGSSSEVACFDTSFHCTQPDVARAFALPEEFTRLRKR